jgi:hypothetical protein
MALVSSIPGGEAADDDSITTAVAFDEHFRQFGTVAVVP